MLINYAILVSHCSQRLISGSCLGQVTSAKWVDAQNQKCLNSDIKFLKSQRNWQRLNMFKATEVEKKIREVNLLIDMQINLSSSRTSVLPAIVMGLVRN